MKIDKTLQDATIVEKLCIIQSELVAPKNLYNKFGGFNYRNVEGILEGLKPLCYKLGCVIITSVKQHTADDGRSYFKATATLMDNNDSISTDDEAMHPIARKGMDDSQVSGATSSYAKKYALNGLFAIDDAKDADSDEKPEATHHTGASIIDGNCTQEQSLALYKLLNNKNTTNGDKNRIKKVADEGYLISAAEAQIMVTDIKKGTVDNTPASKTKMKKLLDKLVKLEKQDAIDWLDKNGWTNKNVEMYENKIKETK